MESAIGLVALVAVAAAVAGTATRFGFSAPLALAGVGVLGSYLPFVPTVELQPDVVLYGLLPPLLYAAALRTSLIDFRRNVHPIAWLSIGLVIVTTVVVGLVAYWLLPIPLAAGLALGAVVAPPDAVAATTIARRVGMPREVVTILEGESLVNDATALVCVRTAIAAVGGSVSVGSVTRDFALSVLGGLVVGAIVAVVLIAIRTRVDNPILDTTLSLLAPFIAYLPAEYVHASGVLAAVVTGLWFGHKSPVMQSAAARIAERTNWRTVQFLLEGVVFLLIGLQASVIIGAVQGSDLGAGTVAVAAVGVFVAAIVVRPLWVFPVAYARQLLPAAMRRRESPPWQYPALVSWAGMRGVVTLAAAFIIPATVPHRDVLVFLALVVVAGTLLLQGSTLPWLVRSLRAHGPDPGEDALQQAVVFQQTTAAGLRRLKEVGGETAPELIEEMRNRAETQANAMWEQLGGSRPRPSASYVALRTAMLEAERAELLRIRDSATVDHEVLERVLAVLDLEESLLERVGEDSSERTDDLVARPPPDGPCEHLRVAQSEVTPHTPGRCDACVAEGLEWVDLRMCLSCGNVACCDSSKGRHARHHHSDSGHPTMRSVEPGEAWRWCFVDEQAG